VRISTGILIILVEAFRRFPQALIANGMVVSRLGQCRFLPLLFKFTIRQPPYHSTLHDLRYRQRRKMHHKKRSTCFVFAI
jgi:hypothetical protein